jgi:hypothetical protein
MMKVRTPPTIGGGALAGLRVVLMAPAGGVRQCYGHDLEFTQALEDPPGRQVLASHQILGKCLPYVATAVPETTEFTVTVGGIQPFEPVQEQL